MGASSNSATTWSRILNILEGRPLPVYGDGKNIRDWIYVHDHNAAVWTVMTRGEAGETFNIGGGNEWRNLDLVHALCEAAAAALDRDPAEVKKLITFVADRPGHDHRYAIDCGKLKQPPGWAPSAGFREGLARTVAWYLANPEWIAGIRSGEYTRWLATHYGTGNR